MERNAWIGEMFRTGNGLVWRIKKITPVTQQKSWVLGPNAFNARGYSQPLLPCSLDIKVT